NLAMDATLAENPAADPQIAGRRAALKVLAEAAAGEIAAGLSALAQAPHAEIRPAETGLVMVRGRIGGDGAAFNLGEATVTRCAVQLATGEVGFAYVLGRDQEKARLVALCDALWQSKEHRETIEHDVLAPIRARQQQARARTREETAATKVDFSSTLPGDTAGRRRRP